MALFASGTTWNLASNWGTTSGASDGAVPTATDDVIFDANSVSMAIDVNAVCLTLNTTGFTGTLTQNTTRTLTVDGILTWAAGTFAGGDAAIGVDDFLLSGGVFTSTSAILTQSGSGGTVVFSGGTFNHNGGKVQTFGDTITNNAQDFFDLGISRGTNNSITITAACGVKGALTPTGGDYNFLDGGSGAFNLEGDYLPTKGRLGSVALNFVGLNDQDFGNGIDIANAPGIVTINKTGGTLTLIGSIVAGGWIYTAGTVVAGTSTVTSNSLNGWTVDAAGMAFNNFTFSQSTNDTAVITGDLNIDGNLVCQGGEYRIDTGTIKLKGNITVTALLRTNGTALLQLVGTGAQAMDILQWAGGDVTINKATGEATMDAAFPLSNAGQALTVTSGIFNTNGFALTVAGAFTVNGATLKLKSASNLTTGSTSINAATSTVIYSDEVATVNLATLTTAYFNLTWGADKIHEIPTGVGNGISVAGELASNGSLANPSILRSVADAAVDHELNLSGTSTLSNKVDVKRCDASAGLEVCAIGSVDNGNNTNWKFVALSGVLNRRKKKKRIRKMTTLKPIEREITPGTTAIQVMADQPCTGLTVQANSANPGKLFVGLSPLTTIELDAGEDWPFDDLANANQVWIKGAGASEKGHVNINGF